MEIVLRRRASDEPITASVHAPPLIASAEAYNVANVQQAQELALTRQRWQQRVLGYYDEVGEIHFPARYIGNALSKIRLVGAEEVEAEVDPGKENPDPIKAPVPTKNKAVRDAISKLKGKQGGQGALLRAMGINLFVAAEVWLVGTQNGKKQEWEALSVDELIVMPGQKNAQRRKQPGAAAVDLPPNALTIRVWVAHPRYSGLADGALRTVMDECEKLLLLTRADKAAARSRFAGAGLLFIPNELMPVSQQPAGTQNNLTDASDNPVYQALVQSMIEPIKDESHPSGVVPITLFGPAEYGDKIRYITFDRPQAARAQQQREESITRIATALDLPAEILTGKADLNHWTAWQVREETFQQHFQPMVELICDALTTGYLRPALIKAGVSEEEAEKYLVWYDDSELVVRPDKGETAAQLYAENVISAAAWRRETGFSETDAMKDDEYAKRVGIVLQDVQLALTGKPTPVPEAPPPGGGTGPGFGGDSPTIKDKLTPPEKKDKMKAATQGTPDTENDQPKPPKPVTASARKRRSSLGMKLAQLDIELMTQLRAAASEVLVRELERAGAKIRSHAQGDRATKELLSNTPNHMVASVLGPKMVQSFGLTEDLILKGAFLAFGPRALAMITAAQEERRRLLQEQLDARAEQLDLDPPYNIDKAFAAIDAANAESGVSVFLAGLTALALDQLYDPAPDAPSTPKDGEFDGQLVPAKTVRRAVSTAGGGTDPDDVGGVGTGETTLSIMRDNGVSIDSRVWVYGPAVRTPFGGHEDLDGELFSTWEDEVLAIQPGDEWLGREYYKPGDHIGCLCAVAPITALDDLEE